MSLFGMRLSSVTGKSAYQALSPPIPKKILEVIGRFKIWVVRRPPSKHTFVHGLWAGD